MRQFRKDQISPFRLPGWFRWIALVMAIGLTFVYFAGGWGSPDIVVGPGQGHTLFILGFVVVAAYVPLYLWRKMTDRRDGVAPLGALPIVVGSPGGVDFGDMSEPHVLDPGSWTPSTGGRGSDRSRPPGGEAPAAPGQMGQALRSRRGPACHDGHILADGDPPGRASQRAAARWPVVSIARIHGSSRTAAQADAQQGEGKQQALVAKAIVAWSDPASRPRARWPRPGVSQTITTAARHAAWVTCCDHPASAAWRLLIEGDLAATSRAQGS